MEVKKQSQFKTILADIEFIKITFQQLLKESLDLIRISAPLFLEKESGLNDDLSGYEEKVSFTFNNKVLEIVQSLAKWKRYALKKYELNGLYADMNAIRKSEELDNLHSIYVDQWDWEMVIDTNKGKTKDEILVDIARIIHNNIYNLERLYWNMKKEKQDIINIPNENEMIKKELYIISSEELLNMYPNLSSNDREREICKKYGSVFIKQIGKKLSNNTVHDLRAPDYDDWEYNGDLIYWSNILNGPIELSSMGVRVNKESLIKQLEICNSTERLKLPYCKMLLNNELPETIGGGIGQSRLCMLILRKEHISQVQCSYWDEKNIMKDTL
ncbi:Aspartate-ammonia ligase family protein [Cryptosporidium hominis]|nr:Aspartate-ammonia ligase [Cryptosporidium hominis]PPA65745.1 Aspartate-ammonia ligase family protein [Cryptosporidium hominis]